MSKISIALGMLCTLFLIAVAGIFNAWRWMGDGEWAFFGLWWGLLITAVVLGIIGVKEEYER